jgi:hypothetical protein
LDTFTAARGHAVLVVSTLSASGLHPTIEEVTLEPYAGQLGNPLQGARLFEEMPCPGHDFEVRFRAHLRQGILIHLD